MSFSRVELEVIHTQFSVWSLFLLSVVILIWLPGITSDDLVDPFSYYLAGRAMLLCLTTSCVIIALLLSYWDPSESGYKNCGAACLILLVIVAIFTLANLSTIKSEGLYVDGNPCSNVPEAQFVRLAEETFCTQECPCKLDTSAYSSTFINSIVVSKDGAETAQDCQVFQSKFEEVSKEVSAQGGGSGHPRQLLPWSLESWKAAASDMETEHSCTLACQNSFEAALFSGVTNKRYSHHCFNEFQEITDDVILPLYIALFVCLCIFIIPFCGQIFCSVIYKSHTEVKPVIRRRSRRLPTDMDVA